MMRQVNFVLIFLVCLAIAFFCLENTNPITVQLLPGKTVEAPLAIELLITMGAGATLAWLFSLWVKLQRQISAMQDYKQVQVRDRRITELEQELQRYKAEIKQQKLPPADEA
ncbi:LapA family protein [Spirulina major]|uniref:LapA family protein n=1 Tax=Spirulina major TaxID=270636 RepID=UPI001C31D370|nr:LapA family protein [Spirulina major]